MNDGDRRDRLRSLTGRQRQILTLRCEGKTLGEIAELIDRAEQTVKDHMGNIYERLGLDHLRGTARDFEVGEYCRTLRTLPNDLPPQRAGQDHDPPETDPPPASETALVAVMEDELALVRGRPSDVQVWVAPPPTPGIGRRPGTFSGLRSRFRVAVILVGVLLVLWLVLSFFACRGPAPSTTPGTNTGSVAGQGQPTPPPAGRDERDTPGSSFLAFGESWLGQGLALTARAAPYQGGGSVTRVDFTLENRTNAALNFEVRETAFYIEFNTGQRYAGNGSGPKFNDLKPLEKRSFTTTFGIAWEQYQTLLRQPVITSLVVGVEGSRFPDSRWRQTVSH